jgi:DNA mismatch repair ATPase MutS
MYDNYHFEEEIVNGDILFQYRLLPGKATTRNAIKLLEIIGYDQEVIQNAQGMAEDFLRTGRWS